MSDIPHLPPSERTRPADSSRNSRLLFYISAGVVAAACVYYGLTADVADPMHLYEGLAILVLATLPGVMWAKKGGQQLPLFEVLMLTTLNTYALPLLSSHAQLRIFPTDVVTYSGLTVILYQLAAIGAYSLVRGQPGRTPFFTKEVISRDINRHIGYGLTLTTIYTYVATFMDVIPFDVASILRAVFYGIGLVSVFVQARRWGLNDLKQHEQIIFVINLAVQVIIQFATLFLIGGISLMVLALVGYVSGARRLPIVVVAILLFVAGVLHSGKSEMRDRYWDADGTRHVPALTDLPSFFGEWVQCAIDATHQSSSDKQITTKLIDRTSLFHLLCLVESMTPDRKPFMDGDTYTDIPAQFVPRFFWNLFFTGIKPPAHIGTYKMSIYYGLQREEDTAKTTIGFGMLIEAYVNFGMFGVGLIGMALGAFYKTVQVRSQNSPLMSYAGLVTIVLMAWSFQTEYTLSMWMTSMFQAFVAVLGIPFLLRNLFG